MTFWAVLTLTHPDTLGEEEIPSHPDMFSSIHWIQNNLISNNFNWLGAAADGLLILMKDEDITQIQKMTKKGDVIEKLN